MKHILSFAAAAAASLLFAGTAIAQEAEASGPESFQTQFDHRGMIEMKGVISEGGNKWGATNLIVKPYGGWAAQDYCFKDIKKSGGGKNMTFTGTLSAGRKVQLVEKTEAVKDEKGRKGLKVTYILTSGDPAKPKLSFERIAVKIPLTTDPFAPGKAILADGTDCEISAEPDGGDVAAGEDSMTIEGKKAIFIVKAKGYNFSLQDCRPKEKRLELWADSPNLTGDKEIKVEYEFYSEKKSN